MDSQVRLSLLLDSITRSELLLQEREQMIADRDNMIQQLQAMIQKRDQQIEGLQHMAANAAGTPAELPNLDDLEVDVVESPNGRDRLPG